MYINCLPGVDERRRELQSTARASESLTTAALQSLTNDVLRPRWLNLHRFPESRGACVTRPERSPGVAPCTLNLQAKPSTKPCTIQLRRLQTPTSSPTHSTSTLTLIATPRCAQQPSPPLYPHGPHPTSTPAKGLDRARQRLSLPEKQSLPLQCLSLVQPASPPPAPPPLNYLWTLNTP